MPTPLPSSFASAAAGNVHDPNKRGDGTTGGEWYAVFLCSVIILVTGVLFFAFPFFLMALGGSFSCCWGLCKSLLHGLDRTFSFLFFSFCLSPFWLLETHHSSLIGLALAWTEQHRLSAARQLLRTLLTTGTAAKPHLFRRQRLVLIFLLTWPRINRPAGYVTD